MRLVLAFATAAACSAPELLELPLQPPSSPLSGGGDTIWVGVESTAATADGSEATPWTSIADALAVASAGDTIQLLPGNYTEAVDVDIAVTIAGAPRYLSSIRHGGSPWTLSASGATLSGLRFEGDGTGIGVRCEAYCVVESSIFEHFASGVYLYRSDGALLQFNRFQDFTTGVFVYRATEPVWVHNNQLVGMSGSSGVQGWDSEVYVLQNLLTGMLYPMHYRRYLTTSPGPSYLIDNLVTDAYRPILAYNAQSGDLYAYYNAFDTTSGVSGTVSEVGNIESACGAPEDGWDDVFDWGFAASGDCEDAGFPFWTDPDGSAADIGANGGPYDTSDGFRAPPAHFRIGFVLVHDGTASADGQDMIEGFREAVETVWTDATDGRGVVIAEGPYEVEWTSDLSDAVAEFLGDGMALSRARARLVAQEVIGDEGDVFDFLVVLDDDIAAADWSTGFKMIHAPAIRDVRYTGNWMYDGSHEFGSASRLRGVGQIHTVAYWQSSPFYAEAGYRATMAMHEGVGHNYGVGALTDVSSSHWSADVIQPDLTYSTMYARPWEQKASGEWGLADDADYYGNDRHFHPVMLYAMGALGGDEVEGVRWLEWVDGEAPPSGGTGEATEHLVSLADIQAEWGGVRRHYDFVLDGSIEVPDGVAGSPVTATVTVDSSLPRSAVLVQVTGTKNWTETVTDTGVGPGTVDVELDPYGSGVPAGSYAVKVKVVDEDGNWSVNEYNELLGDKAGTTDTFTVTP